MINESVEVNESLLTGESLGIKKNIGDTILTGSYIISGSCSVRADKIANDTYLSSIESKTKQFKAPKSKLTLNL